MKKLTKKQLEILANLDPRCEDCEHYREHRGTMMCHALGPFLAYKKTQRLRPAGKSINCGIEGRNFSPKAPSLAGES